MYPLLQGLRAVECASFIAAPSCTLYLQQFGAEVIRIDPVGGGPDFHRWPVSERGDSYYWGGLNKGKKSVAVDLSRPEGRELAVRIITAPGANGGIFVTNFPRKGFLSHEALRGQREDLITLRIEGWSDGEPAVDYTINAAVGIPYMTGPDQGDQPVNHVLPAWDLLTGAYAAYSVLAAERYRRDTGQGQEVLLSLSNMAIATLGNLGQIAEVLTGGDRPRMGNALFGAFGRDFVTADGARVMIVAITARQWSGLLEALGLQEAIAAMEADLGVSFGRDEGARFTHRDHLFPLFERAIGQRSLPSLREAFTRHGVCWSIYRTLGEAIQNEPRLSPDGPLFTRLTHPSGVTYPAPGAAAHFMGTERQPAMSAPRLGEHTDAVLAEVLGLSPSQIAQLHADGLVAGPRA